MMTATVNAVTALPLIAQVDSLLTTRRRYRRRRDPRPASSPGRPWGMSHRPSWMGGGAVLVRSGRGGHWSHSDGSGTSDQYRDGELKNHDLPRCDSGHIADWSKTLGQLKFKANPHSSPAFA